MKRRMPWWILALSIQTVTAIIQLDLWRDTPSHDLAKRSLNIGEITLENTVSFYQTELFIGTPPQRVLVQVDTGSSDLWVISADNPYCSGQNSKCASLTTFSAEDSTSFKANETSSNFSITYGDSTFASGIYVQDDIQIGGVDFLDSTRPSMHQHAANNPSPPPAPMRIKKGNFALATTANSSEAVWGIGMESTESMARYITPEGKMYPTYSNIPMQMKEQGLIETVAYSLWLNDLNSASGTLLFGAVDHSKYLGELQRIPMVSVFAGIDTPLDFSVMFHGIGAYNAAGDTASIVECSVPVLLDSGTTYTQLPQQMIEPVANALGAIFFEKEGVYLINETQRSHLEGGGLNFNLSGVQIEVSLDELLIPIGYLQTPSSYIHGSGRYRELIDLPDHIRENFVHNDPLLETGHSKAHKHFEFYYLLGMFPVEFSVGGGNILGDTFLRSAYAVYDLENHEVAIANTRYNATSSQLDVIGSKGIPNAKQAPMYSATSLAESIITFSADYLFAADQVSSPLPDGNTQALSSPVTPQWAATAVSSLCCKHPSSTGYFAEQAMHGHHHRNEAARDYNSGKTILGLLLSVVLL